MTGKKKLAKPRKPRKMICARSECYCGAEVKYIFRVKETFNQHTIDKAKKMLNWLDKAIRYLEHKQQQGRENANTINR